MSNIIALDPSVSFTVEQALDSAKRDSSILQDVLIVGYDTDGGLFIRSSRMGRRDALWLLKKAELYILEPET